jgi:hypothetical protein
MRKNNAALSTPEHWKKHIAVATALEQAADRNKARAILDKGLRIAGFHAAEKEHKWFKSWDEACQKVVGLTHQACSRYEIAGVNLASTNCNILPPNLDVLYWLGCAQRDNPAAFAEAIKANEIHPQMTRKKAKDLCQKLGGQKQRRGSQKKPIPPMTAQLLEALDGVVEEVRAFCKKEIQICFPDATQDDRELAQEARVELADLMIARVYSDDASFALLRERVEAHASRGQSEAA